MEQRVNIIILSAGSLLSQNILDQLEGRRNKVRVIGLDCSASNPRVFRCDQAYKSPLIDDPDFDEFLIDIIDQEKPDLILAGRDHDAQFLSEFKEKYLQYSDIIPCGASSAARIMNDKALSTEFASKYQLPFVSTHVFYNDDFNQVLEWSRTKHFPLLLKPREGFGSLGMRILCNEANLQACKELDLKDFVLQEMVDLSAAWEKMIRDYEKYINAGIPFFFHMPDENQYAGQTLIRPDGTIGEIFASRSLMVIGRCERTERWDDPSFISVIKDYAEAISKEGWRGSFNLQCRKTETGYAGIEMNGRMTGSTSARLWLGYDEIRELLKSFRTIDLGSDPRVWSDQEGIVYRSLTDYYVQKSDQTIFMEQGQWINPNSKFNGDV